MSALRSDLDGGASLVEQLGLGGVRHERATICGGRAQAAAVGQTPHREEPRREHSSCWLTERGIEVDLAADAHLRALDRVREPLLQHVQGNGPLPRLPAAAGGAAARVIEPPAERLAALATRHPAVHGPLSKHHTSRRLAHQSRSRRSDTKLSDALHSKKQSCACAVIMLERPNPNYT